MSQVPSKNDPSGAGLRPKLDHQTNMRIDHQTNLGLAIGWHRVTFVFVDSRLDYRKLRQLAHKHSDATHKHKNAHTARQLFTIIRLRRVLQHIYRGPLSTAGIFRPNVRPENFNVLHVAD